MSQFFISMQPGSTVMLPLALWTGSTKELRIQDAAPLNTSLTVDNDNIVAVSIEEGPTLKIDALQEGQARAEIRVNMGGRVRFRILVETERTGLRWQPKDIPFEFTAPPLPPVDPFPPGSVDGPNSSPHGQDFWIQRDMQDVWYVWWDVDSEFGPDVKKLLSMALADEGLDADYRADIAARAAELGYTG